MIRLCPYPHSGYDFHCLSALQRRLMNLLCIMPWTPCLILARGMPLLEGSKSLFSTFNVMSLRS